MPCGCSQPTTDPTSNLVVCLWCPDRASLTTCSINGEPLASLANTGACPAGRHLDRDGVCTVIGIRWYGVPAPFRWALRTKVGRLIAGGGARVRGYAFPGCGCVRRAKDLWAKLRGPNDDRPKTGKV